MRVLHVVKTSEGAGWAAAQAAELIRMGVAVHVALPDLRGRVAAKWADCGAIVHIAPADLSLRRLSAVPGTLKKLRNLVADIRPDIIHSHFVSSALLVRLALGKRSRIPRIFQVPGPLHLEHRFWRNVEIRSASAPDVWIASSRCILDHYRRAGIADSRLYLSYYGARIENYTEVRQGDLRKRFGIPESARVVGNANFIYSPKWYLGQRRGLKAHEDVIDALGIVLRARPDVVGVLIGGGFPHPTQYEATLRKRAMNAGGGRIIMTGYLPQEDICRMWPDFDLAVHVPLSENCGGVVEPMFAGVPVIAGRVGGLPELVLDGLTGRATPICNPELLARAILDALNDEHRTRGMTAPAQRLVKTMFDVRRTAREVRDVYAHLANAVEPAPLRFDPMQHVSSKSAEGCHEVTEIAHA